MPRCRGLHPRTSERERERHTTANQGQVLAEWLQDKGSQHTFVCSLNSSPLNNPLPPFSSPPLNLVHTVLSMAASYLWRSWLRASALGSINTMAGNWLYFPTLLSQHKRPCTDACSLFQQSPLVNNTPPPRKIHQEPSWEESQPCFSLASVHLLGA